MDFLYLGYMGYLGVIGALMVTAAIPGLYNELRNEPNENGAGQPVSRFGFFTKLEPGQQKIIVIAGRFVTIIMDHFGHTFRGWTKEGANLTRRNPDFWEVVQTPEGESDAHPVPFRRWEGAWSIGWFLLSPIVMPWWVWKRWTYFVTGLVFTGIYPVQQVLVYQIERFKEMKDGDGNLMLDRKRDWTDFFWAKAFPFWFAIASSDTSDGAGVKLYVMLTLRISNAFKLAFTTDEQWSSRLLGSSSSVLNDVTRVHSLKQVLASEGGVDTMKVKLQEAVMRELDARLGKYGLDILEADFPDRSPADANLATQIQAEAAAKYQANARITLAKADAEATVLNANAIKEGGATGVFAAQMETQVRVAREAGDRAVITIGGQSQDSPLMAAILKEIQEQNRKG